METAQKGNNRMLNIIEGKVKRAVKTVIYGPEGVGKSTLASKAPDALFLDLESGSDQLAVRRLAGVKDWETFLKTIDEVAAEPSVCKTLVIDTIDSAEARCITYLCEKYGKASLESFVFGKGYLLLRQEFVTLLNKLNGLIESGINVILVSHAALVKRELPDENGSFDRYELKLNKLPAQLVKEWSDMLLFANFQTHVVTTETGTRKGIGNKRVIHTTHHAAWDAKNRFGLPDEMDLDKNVLAPLYDAIQPTKTLLEQLQDMMVDAGVSEAEIQKVVADKGHYSADTPISAYEDRFIRGWLIRYWDQIVPLINKSRNSAEG